MTGRSQPSVSCAIYRGTIAERTRENRMDSRLKITDVTGPYREPREQVFSCDYSISTGVLADRPELFA